MKKFLIIGLAVALAIGFIVWKITFKKADTSVQDKKADVEILASNLLSEFETNESAANTKYLDKIIVVEGIVADVKKDTSGVSVYLKEPESMSGVLCGFNKNTQIPHEIKVGETLKIKGVCNGYLMDVLLNKCSVEP